MFTKSHPVTIVGGGLAGLALGIGLRQQQVPVRVVEAGRYPRHRVCGEFLSGRGEAMLGALGALEPALAAGARRAETARFYLGGLAGPIRQLPCPAICVSRFALDALLADRFRALGGELIDNTRWRPHAPDEAGLVQACGRRLEKAGNGQHWFGLKVHAENVKLTADLEMHSLSHGYVGLCAVERGRINVSGLFWRRPGVVARESWREFICGPPGSALRRKLENAVFDETSFTSVAGLSLASYPADSAHCCRIGDAYAMIPPVTGNGMSLALESASLAVAPLAGFSQGHLSWEETTRQIRHACNDRFGRRLAWARWLQAVLSTRALRGFAGPLMLHSGSLWRFLFSKTR